VESLVGWLSQAPIDDQRLITENIMLLASVFRAISLQMCRVARIAGSDAASRRGAHRPNSVPRWKPVRGAASEPHYTDARVDSPADGRAEIGFA
jgi:hypothetical protein